MQFSGLFSSLLREQANISHQWPKWIVLDGDIDPMWIESLNTVMDDNKVSTWQMELLYLHFHLATLTHVLLCSCSILFLLYFSLFCSKVEE